MKNNDYAIFDVCSDYSLSIHDKNIFKSEKHLYSKRTIEILNREIVLYNHIQYQELHYAYAPKSFEGIII